MAVKGVLLIASGTGSYAQWAANMAASVRYHNPGLPIALLVDEKAKTYITDHERERLYDYIIDIDKDDSHPGGTFAPGHIKLNLYKYSPFEETVYLDVDGLCIRPLDGLFDLCSEKDVASQVVTTTDQTAERWDCQWMSLDDTKRVYGLPETFILQECNSSFFYFKKNAAAAEYFNVALQCYLPTYKTTWGKSFPDELAFNVAGALLNMDISLLIYNCPIVFSTRADDPSKLPGEIYVIGLYGAQGLSSQTVYKMYDRHSNKYFVSIMGRTCPYKYGQLMSSKFVVAGRSMMGKHTGMPDPINIVLPVRKNEPVAVSDEEPATPVEVKPKATKPKAAKKGKAVAK